MKMSVEEITNTIVRQNISVAKVVELKNKINVNAKDIYESPMTYKSSFLDNIYLVTYMPLYDTTNLIGGNDTYHLFTEPIDRYKSQEKTNMILPGRLPLPNIFVVKGFSILTDTPKEKLDKVMMDFRVIARSYANMPLSHLPFEYPVRIIISEQMNFQIELRNTGEMIQDKLVFFINGWELRAVK